MLVGDVKRLDQAGSDALLEDDVAADRRARSGGNTTTSDEQDERVIVGEELRWVGIASQQGALDVEGFLEQLSRLVGRDSFGGS